MNRYHVISSNGRWSPLALQDWLDIEAEKGWRLVSTFWTAQGNLFFVFEWQGKP